MATGLLKKGKGGELYCGVPPTSDIHFAKKQLSQRATNGLSEGTNGLSVRTNRLSIAAPTPL